MTEPYMAKALDKSEWSPTSQEAAVKPRRYGWRRLLRRFAWVVCIGWCAMALTGCSDFWGDVGDLFRIGGGGSAEAQDETVTRVKTYAINTDGFEIRLDNDTDTTPSLGEASDNATILTMNSAGTLDTGDSNVPLEMNDIIILRLDGTTGSATLIRAN